MVTSFGMDLFRDPFFIGFNRDMERMRRFHEQAMQQPYPPYDLVEVDTDTYELSIAVAGFAKEDIDVSVDNGTLIVKGEKEKSDDKYVHKGIATRKFTRTYALGEYMEVTGANLENGMLTITVERIVPEEKKPKTIKIK